MRAFRETFVLLNILNANGTLTVSYTQSRNDRLDKISRTDTIDIFDWSI